jgi:ribulose-5-phosphate 4-epimerase/fuculose-1-phosphate aldolase
MAEYDDLRTQCLQGARILWRELRDVMGHVSCRLPNGEGFVLKMVRIPPEPIDPDSVMTFDFDCNRLQGEQPILEPYIHSEILRARPEVNAVVHVHPHMATVISTTGKTVYAVTHQSAQFEEGLPVFHGRWITTPQLGQDLAACLGDGPAALMKGHGVVIAARSVPQAVELALYVEQAAKQIMWASAVGTPELFPEELRHAPERRVSPTAGEGPSLWRQLVWELNSERREVT